MAAVLLVSACSGDSRPLTEAVEAENLQLAGLDIVAPAGTVEPLFIASGERIDFSLRASNTAGALVEIDDRDRRWSVSDPTVAFIDDNGVLTGRAEGEVEVRVRIAGIEASAFSLTVSNAALAGIDVIDGEESLARCVPGTYSAIGSFEDGSRRRLGVVSWSLDAISTASLVTAADGSVALTARDAGGLTLNVGAGGFTLARVLTVQDSLESIAIGPAVLALEEDDSLQLIATGTYTEGDTFSEQAITNSVEWRIVTGTDLVTVSNSGQNRGLLRAREAGVASVEAACGDVVAVREVVVSESSSSEGLVFEEGSELVLRVGGATAQLNVSTGSRYDEDQDVTSGADFFLIGVDEGVISLSSTTPGLVTPLRIGEATVEARFGERSARIVVRVR